MACWVVAKEKALDRDERKCQECGATEKLEVHHKDHDIHSNDLENLITLCRKCHVSHHKDWRQKHDPPVTNIKFRFVVKGVPNEMRYRILLYMNKRGYRLNKQSKAVLELIEIALKAEGV